jgi:phosphoribosylformylglycinamidine synthase
VSFRFGVVVFPGSNCEQDVVYALDYLGYTADYVWHQDHSLAGCDAVILPGGFSYGDYLRCGAIARFSPIMEAVVRFAQDGGPIMGICNGFQVLTEAHLLPGALIRNKGLKFLCREVPLRVEQSVCQWLKPTTQTLRLPINHNEGNYRCDAATLKSLVDNCQVVLRYGAPDCAPGYVPERAPGYVPERASGYVPERASERVSERVAGGAPGSMPSSASDAAGLAGAAGTAEVAPNGALDNIAGICNREGNVFGLMPHPERVCDGISGNSDGIVFFETIAQRLCAV